MNRRRFITTTTAAGLGAALLPRAARRPDPTPSVGVSKVRKLIDRDEVDVIVGTIHSGVAAAIRNPIVDAKKLWLNPIATNDLLAEQGCSRYHFRFSNSAWQSAAPLGPWTKAKLGDRAYICVFNFAFGQQSAAHFKKAFTEAGGTVVRSEEHTSELQ